MNSLLTVNRHRMQTPPAVCKKLSQRADVGICPYYKTIGISLLCKGSSARRISRNFLPLPQHDASDACEVGDGVYLGIAVFL